MIIRKSKENTTHVIDFMDAAPAAFVNTKNKEVRSPNLNRPENYLKEATLLSISSRGIDVDNCFCYKIIVIFVKEVRLVFFLSHRSGAQEFLVF